MILMEMLFGNRLTMEIINMPKIMNGFMSLRKQKERKQKKTYEW